ncbi:MAG: nuclear transport factor 2 family protein [Bacteroidota bacterium]
MTPETIVQQQVEAYNTRNLAAFADCFAEDIQLFNFQQLQPYLSGKQALREAYGDVFGNSPDLHATIVQRIVLGNKVIDHEQVVGRKGVDFIDVVVVYEVENGLINRVTYIRKT